MSGRVVWRIGGSVMLQRSSVTDLRGILQRVALQDMSAFHRLCVVTRQKLLSQALLVVSDRRDAEEAVQDAFLSVWMHAASYDQNSSFSPISWLCVIVRRKAIDIRRRRFAKWDELQPTLADGALTPEETSILSDKRRVVSRLVGRLDAAKRSVVEGAYIDGEKYNDLARRLQLPVNTVRTRLKRALGELKLMAEAEMVV